MSAAQRTETIDEIEITCDYTGKCKNNQCKCKKKGVKCTSHCHLKKSVDSKKCENKLEN